MNTPECDCGCGQRVKLAHQSDTKRGYVKGEPMRFVMGHNMRARRRASGYAQKFKPQHHKARGDGLVYEHVLIAEKALGRILPPKAEVHHVDGNSLNNSPGNLVICQDKAYHKLLHYRAKVRALGGDPNTEKHCCDCREIKLLTEFNLMRANKSTGRQSICRACGKIRDAAKRERKRLAAEHGVYIPQPGEVELATK